MNMNEALQQSLYDKLSREQDKYRDWLKGQPPEEILHHSYEYTVREDILMSMEELTLSEAEIGMLLGAREDALQASGRALLGLDARTLSLSPAEQTRLLHKIRTLPRGALQAALDGAARDVCRALGLPGAEGYVQAALRALVPRLYEAARHGSVRAVFPVAAEEK